MNALLYNKAADLPTEELLNAIAQAVADCTKCRPTVYARGSDGYLHEDIGEECEEELERREEMEEGK